jgi:two-component system chemotaxis response regulator CheB
MKRIRVLVVEDSLTVRMRLIAALAADPECDVVGEAADCASAIAMCQALRPDVVTLDMILRGNDGLEVTEQVMAYCPTPIVIVSETIRNGELPGRFDALAAGAVDLIEKPVDGEVGGEWDRRFLSTVKLASRVKVITHIRARMRHASKRELPTSVAPVALEQRRYDLIAIGASTGGPGAVLEILRNRKIPLPILLVIHSGQSCGITMAEWLDTVLPVPVSEAQEGEPVPEPGEGRVIVAPANQHLVVQQGRLRVTQGPERNSCRPSVDVLFESVAREIGPAAIGCLLTGMGRDGAEGLRGMKQRGAMTLVQDEASSAVFGMPREAIRLGAASRIVPLSQIGPVLTLLAHRLEFS